MGEVFEVIAEAALELDGRRLARLSRGALFWVETRDDSAARRITVHADDGEHHFEAVLFDLEEMLALGWLRPATLN